jgi:hypothetical protein
MLDSCSQASLCGSGRKSRRGIARGWRLAVQGLGAWGGGRMGEARALGVSATHFCQGKGSVSLFLKFLNHRSDLGGASSGLTTTRRVGAAAWALGAVWQDKARRGTVVRRGASRPLLGSSQLAGENNTAPYSSEEEEASQPASQPAPRSKCGPQWRHYARQPTKGKLRQRSAHYCQLLESAAAAKVRRLRWCLESSRNEALESRQEGMGVRSAECGVLKIAHTG